MLMCIKPYPLFWIINIKPSVFHFFNLVPRGKLSKLYSICKPSAPFNTPFQTVTFCHRSVF